MIKCLTSGDLYCTLCERLCDNVCYNKCIHYRSCSSCTHFKDEFEHLKDDNYCDGCSYTKEKWEDKYIHGGIYK